jgi:hypothetical protein
MEAPTALGPIGYLPEAAAPINLNRSRLAPFVYHSRDHKGGQDGGTLRFGIPFALRVEVIADR